MNAKNVQGQVCDVKFSLPKPSHGSESEEADPQGPFKVEGDLFSRGSELH